jgi:hypothetical protein
MIRYTVTYSRQAIDDLTCAWLKASDRLAITQAGDDIDQRLRFNAAHHGEPLGGNLRSLTVSPMYIEFTVDDEDRMVTDWTVRHIGELTNGH